VIFIYKILEGMMHGEIDRLKIQDGLPILAEEVMKKKAVLLFCSLILFLVFASDLQAADEINVYLYNFEPFSFRWTNKFKKEDRVLSFRPSIETELKNFPERKFELSLSLIDSEGKIIFSKSQEIERVEEDKKDFVIVVFYLEEMIPFPTKATIEVTWEKGRLKKDIPLEFVRIHGKSTNFDGSPRKDFILVKDNGFEDVYVGQCQEDGRYEMILPKRTYNGFIIDDETYDYQTLENWVWNFTAHKDMELNYQVGSLEVYNLHVWPNNGGASTIFISFRPMSLYRGNLMDRNNDYEVSDEERKKGKSLISEDEFKDNPYTGLAPVLDRSEVRIFVDETELEVVSVQPYLEYILSEGGVNRYVTSYVVQAIRGRNGITPGRHFARVVIQDELELEGRTIIEKGEASYHWLQEGNIHNVARYRY
jgi:hypothetical protein